MRSFWCCLLVASCSIALSVGCKSNPEPAPSGAGPEGEPPAASSFASALEPDADLAPPADSVKGGGPDVSVVKAPAKRAGVALSVVKMRALMAQVGCPAQHIQDDGCAVCPELLTPGAASHSRPFVHVAEWADVGVLSMPGKKTSTRPMHALQAKWGGDGELATWLVYYGCAEGDDSMRGHAISILRTREAGGVEVLARLVGNSDKYAIDACAFPASREGGLHTVCVVSGGSAYSWRYDVLVVSADAAGDGVLLAGSEAELDPDDMRFPEDEVFAIIRVEDVDGDGDEDVIARKGAETLHLVQAGGAFEVIEVE